MAALSCPCGSRIVASPGAREASCGSCGKVHVLPEEAPTPPPVESRAGTVWRWGSGAGAALALAAFFVPQWEVAGRSWSPFTLLFSLRRMLETGDFLYHAAWLLVPPAAALLLLAASTRRGRRSPLLLWLCQILLLAGAFAMATQGSIVLTSLQAQGGTGGASSTLALLLFSVPLLAGAVVLARVLGGAAAELTGAVARASIGALLALNALYMADFWWHLYVLWTSAAGADRGLAGAALAPAAGLVVAVAEAAGAVRARVPEGGLARAS